VSVKRLGGERAGEMRITRFLRNKRVTTEEMIETAVLRTQKACQGRRVLAIQDTTTLRAGARGEALAAHPTLAVDADSGAVLGLVHAEIFSRKTGADGGHKTKRIEDKQSRRWLDGQAAASGRLDGIAEEITTIADREGDFFEDFALRPEGMQILVRACNDRCLEGGGRLFSDEATPHEAGRLKVPLPARPGQRAREAKIAVRFGEVVIRRPDNRRKVPGGKDLPESVSLRLVVAEEVSPPKGVKPVSWRLLTSHAVDDAEAAIEMITLYRRRWAIEQLFRTMKTKGFDVEALPQQEGGPFERLATAILIAAVSVMQLVHARDGKTDRPFTDVLEEEDEPLLARLSEELEGKTAKQKTPHPPGSLAFAAWVIARLGGWNCYYGKPGPITMARGQTDFQSIKRGWQLLDV
jgi:hypothetical protein